MALRWRADSGPTLYARLFLQEIRTSIAKIPYLFVIFQGEGPDPLSPSGSAHADHVNTKGFGTYFICTGSVQ